MLKRVLYLRQMLKNASRSASQLQQQQQRLLGELVRDAARHVPFYGELYAQAGMQIQRFDPRRDLPHLPVVDKAMLRAAAERGVARTAPPDRELVTISTSGSSGEPFRFRIDRDHDQWRKAQYLRAYLAGGRRLRDRVLRMTGFVSARRPWFARLGWLQEQQISCTAEPTAMAAAWENAAAQVLLGYPSSLRALANHCRERGRPLEPTPRLVFSDSELLLPETRALLEQQFRTPVLDVFGTFETDNIAFQCSRRTGFHIATDCVILEILRDGQPVAAGECGEIVVTVLRNHTSPFIRYNLHDLGSLAPEPCPCGLPFPLLTALQGRAADTVRFADGREQSAAGLMTALYPLVSKLRQYQVRQLAIDRFELLIVPAAVHGPNDRETLLTAMRDLLEGADCSVRCVEHIAIEKSGKRRAFVGLAGAPC